MNDLTEFGILKNTEHLSADSHESIFVKKREIPHFIEDMLSKMSFFGGYCLRCGKEHLFNSKLELCDECYTDMEVFLFQENVLENDEVPDSVQELFY